MPQDKIIIKGARVHNLKNIDLEVPRDKLVVFTGLSGSGKSSLAFDTIYAEGQRRYVESLSAYARQFLGQMDKPDLDYIEGLSPAISIDQKSTSHNPRSTVGTVTEIYDYLRLLFARIGQPHCHRCGRPIARQEVSQMVDTLLSHPEHTRLLILAPLVRGRKGEHQKALDDARRAGYVRIRVDGLVRELSEEIQLEKNKKHSLEVVVDRIVVREGVAGRLADSLETTLSLGEGTVLVQVVDGEELVFSNRLACAECGIGMAELDPRSFSFNSPFGACPNCTGLGVSMEADLELVINNPDLSLVEGVIAPWNGAGRDYYHGILTSLAKHYGFSMRTPWRELTPEQRSLVLYGSQDTIQLSYTSRFGGSRGREAQFEGVFPNLNRRYREASSESARNEMEQFMSARPCQACGGARLKPEALSVLIGERNIDQVTRMTVAEALDFSCNVKLTSREEVIGRQVLKEITARLGFLVDVGLDYLTLARSAATLSGGEAQRIRLATQIGSGLAGVLYVLDEPSIGLHQRDNLRLLSTLKRLRDLGNTVIVVEHDEETMWAADYLVDIGPGAGAAGGRVVACGTPAEVASRVDSLTGQYLSGRRRIGLPHLRRPGNGSCLEVRGAREHNLKDLELSFPLGSLVLVTGVSGSGKSTLVNEIIYKALARRLHGAHTRPGDHDGIGGIEHLDKVIAIDQAPIGRTPRSNPATYTGLFDDVRTVFSLVPEARARGYRPGRFSFNVRGGRCEACEGDGIIKIEMHFLPDVYVPCEVCHGSRFNRETLQIKYKGKDVAEVLGMSVDEAAEFFAPHPKIYRRLRTLQDVGLGYMRLGQPATTLSGGEAQRVKLASELSRRSTGRTLYILDEPTTGLHSEDIRRLLAVLQRLVEGGNTVLVIEHNLDVIKTADYIIDLGPDGGDRGGWMMACGTPEEVAANPASHTGQFLVRVLARDAGYYQERDELYPGKPLPGATGVEEVVAAWP